MNEHERELRLARAIASRADRLKRLLETGAPALIVGRERSLLSKAVEEWIALDGERVPLDLEN